MSDSTMDTTVYRFRTAVGGFHKGDVTEYIARSAANHRTELEKQEKRINTLEEENQALRQQLNLLMMSAAVLENDEPEIQAEEEKPQDIPALELQAYRRAEAAERLANLRAKKLYENLELICQEAEGEFSSANDTVQETVETIRAQAKHLEAACGRLSLALSSSREKLASMDAMVPDPAEDLEAELCEN